MKRFLAVMFVAALGTTLTLPAYADTFKEKVKAGAHKTKDAVEKAEDKVEDKAKD
jgi:hypothetical protein